MEPFTKQLMIELIFWREGKNKALSLPAPPAPHSGQPLRHFTKWFMDDHFKTTKLETLQDRTFFVSLSMIFNILSKHFFHIHVICFIEGRVTHQSILSTEQIQITSMKTDHQLKSYRVILNFFRKYLSIAFHWHKSIFRPRPLFSPQLLLSFTF